MAITVGDILTEARALLNDSAAQTYTTAVLAPFGKIAMRDLQQHFLRNNIPLIHKTDTVQTVTALAVTYPNPVDIVEPINLYERAVGSTDNFVLMLRTNWEPEVQQTDTLRYWQWKGGVITLLGSTASRSVKLEYNRTLTDVDWTVLGTGFPPGLDPYLAARIAELASAYIGNNPSRAASLGEKADEALELILAIDIKNLQSMPVSRIPYRGRVNRFAGFTRIPRG